MEKDILMNQNGGNCTAPAELAQRLFDMSVGVGKTRQDAAGGDGLAHMPGRVLGEVNQQTDDG
jgi:hypothetical protein